MSGRQWLPFLTASALVLLTLVGLDGTGAAAAESATPVVSLFTNAPNGPFSSGQYIEVKVGPNRVLRPGSRVIIEECSAPTLIDPDAWGHCDHRTIQHDHITAGRDGSVDYPDYPVFALPDKTLLDERSKHRPVCDLTHPCVLLVGRDLDGKKLHASSLPFTVNPTEGDTGANPGNGLPETPYVLALPVLAFGILGGSVAFRRRRSATSID